MKGRVQRYWMVGSVEREVRCLRGAVYDNFVELPFEVTHRREDAADTLDRIQVGIVERVVACDGRLPGTVRLPRSERAGGVDLAPTNSLRARRQTPPRAARPPTPPPALPHLNSPPPLH